MHLIKTFWQGFKEGFYQEATRLQPIIVWLTFILVLYLSFVRPAYSTPDCMTIKEARAKYPTAHLYKTKGCWGVGKPRSVERRPNVMLKDREFLNRVSLNDPALDANGMYQRETALEPIVVEALSQQDRFQTFALVDERKKADRLPLLFQAEAESEPEPVPLPPVKIRVIDLWPKWAVWLLVLGFVVLFSLLLATSIILLRGSLPSHGWRLTGGRRKTDDDSSPVARPTDKPAPRRQRAPAGSDGAGDQQSHLHQRDVYDWSGRAYERGHADHPHPFADRRDDTGALGAWARSRGLRAEAGARDADQSNSAGDAAEAVGAGRPRKRFAIFAWR